MYYSEKKKKKRNTKIFIYIFTKSILIRENNYKVYIFKYGMRTLSILVIIAWTLGGYLNNKSTVKMEIDISCFYVYLYSIYLYFYSICKNFVNFFSICKNNVKN